MKESGYVLNIKQKREKLNYSQRQLAKILGVNFTTVSKWELGIAYPRFSTLLKLADVFKCSINDLIEKDMLLASANRQ